MCHCRMLTSQNACDQLDCSSEGRPSHKCCVELVRGPGRGSWESMLLVKRAEWYGRIIKISWLSRMPSTYALCPKGRMRMYYSSWSQRHIRSPLWMGVIGMPDTKAVTVPCPYYKNAFGGQGWPTRWDKLLGPAHAASSMRVASPRPLYTPLWLLLPWISCMLTFQALRPHWSQTSHLELLMSLCSKTIS